MNEYLDKIEEVEKMIKDLNTMILDVRKNKVISAINVIMDEKSIGIFKYHINFNDKIYNLITSNEDDDYYDELKKDTQVHINKINYENGYIVVQINDFMSMASYIIEISNFKVVNIFKDMGLK